MQFANKQDAENFFNSTPIDILLVPGQIIRLLNKKDDTETNLSGSYYEVIGQTENFIKLREIKYNQTIFNGINSVDFFCELKFHRNIPVNVTIVKRKQNLYRDPNMLEECKIKKNTLKWFNIISPDFDIWNFNKIYRGVRHI